MRCDLILLAGLPSALGAVFAYNPSPVALERAKANASCDLPVKYSIRNFAGKTNGTSGALPSYKFNYVDLTTNLTTVCQHSASSVPVTRGNGTASRYACTNKNVEYIWEDTKDQLTMVERICPGANGAPLYEVSGSTNIKLSCSQTSGDCRSNTTSYTSLFTGFDPILN